jgi:hypothetical protein
VVNNILADIIFLVHFLFILFVIFGAVLSLFNMKWAWFHGPALIWGIYIELSGRICPLTPFENILRNKGSGAGYNAGFIDYYLGSLIYPEGLTRDIQIFLGLSLLVFNLLVYSAVFIRRHNRNSA